MILKILHSGLFLFVVFMGIKQGFAIISGETEMMEMFEEFNFNKTEILLFGITTLGSGILIFFPKTFLAGNFLMAATILLLIFLQIQNQNIKGAFIEIPFLAMNLILVYWKHPFTKVLLN
ncbi:hypothetical protein [Flavobacterium sp. JAS]|uniref:hypothetical protein n=1 Tax=Flavobacterium sp. JAS TaxID=2897329 RepID=UPI001E500494|nr:hypothetical protein [Flavobacterium sp. JAS]MCD0468386.1 hypothetical protein [Flavobacterium sp. JAS]